MYKGGDKTECKNYPGMLFLSTTYRNLIFKGPCIVMYSYNKSKQDALFLNFILVKESTYFGQTYRPPSGVLILYSHQLVFFILITLTLCQRARDGSSKSVRNMYRVLFQNKVEKQCILLAFVIRIQEFLLSFSK